MPKGQRLPNKVHLGGYIPADIVTELKKISRANGINQTMVINLVVRKGYKILSSNQSVDLVVPHKPTRKQPVKHIGGYVEKELYDCIQEFGDANNLTKTASLTMILREGLKGLKRNNVIELA